MTRKDEEEDDDNKQCRYWRRRTKPLSRLSSSTQVSTSIISADRVVSYPDDDEEEDTWWTIHTSTHSSTHNKHTNCYVSHRSGNPSCQPNDCYGIGIGIGTKHLSRRSIPRPTKGTNTFRLTPPPSPRHTWAPTDINYLTFLSSTMNPTLLFVVLYCVESMSTRRKNWWWHTFRIGPIACHCIV